MAHSSGFRGLGGVRLRGRGPVLLPRGGGSRPVEGDRLEGGGAAGRAARREAVSRTIAPPALKEAGPHRPRGCRALLAAGEAAERAAGTPTARRGDGYGWPHPMSFRGSPTGGDGPAGVLAAHPQVSVEICICRTPRSISSAAGSIWACERGARRFLPAGAAALRRAPLARRHAAYLERHGRPQHPDDLKRHACLGYAYLPTPDRWHFFDASGTTPRSQPSPTRANNADAFWRRPCGRGSASRCSRNFTIWDDLGAGRLERVMPDWQPPPIALNLVMPPACRGRRGECFDCLPGGRVFAAVPWLSALAFPSPIPRRRPGPHLIHPGHPARAPRCPASR